MDGLETGFYFAKEKPFTKSILVWGDGSNYKFIVKDAMENVYGVEQLQDVDKGPLSDDVVLAHVAGKRKDVKFADDGLVRLAHEDLASGKV